MQKPIEDESFLERTERKIKNCLNTVVHELLQSQIFSPFLFQLLIFIETIQLLYFSILETLPFLWDSKVIEVIREIVQYFQIHVLLREDSEQIFLVLLYTIFAIQIIILVMTVVTTIKIMGQNNSTTFVTYSIKFLSSYGLLLNTILTIPFFNSFMATLYCNNSDGIHSEIECYKGLYFLHLAIAIIGTIILLLFCFIFSILYIDTNPSSSVPFASPISSLTIIKLLLKLLLCIYVTLDYKGSIATEYIIILAIYYLLILIQRYRSPKMFNQQVFTFTVICESILFWITFCVMVHAILDFDEIDDIGIVFTIVGIPIVTLLFHVLVFKKKIHSLKMTPKDFKKDTDVEGFINILIQLVETIENPDSRVLIEGVLRFHIRYCQKGEQCICQKLNNEFDPDEDIKVQVKNWYYFVQVCLEDGIEKFPKSSRLHILHSYIQNQNLYNRFKALFELQCAQECKPNFQEEFCIFRYKNLIEEELVENDIRTTENKGVDVNQIIDFQKMFVQFLGSIEKCVVLYLEFWRELIEDNPDIQKLQSLGSKITQILEVIQDEFKKLTEINSNHINTLKKYGIFLREIVNDEQESTKVLEKMEFAIKSSQQNKQFVDNYRQKYGENSNTCIINISGNKNNTGIVLNCNNEITRILGFQKNDVQGQNVKIIMGKCYADYHDGILEHFLKTSEEKVINKERVFIAQDKSGYMIPCSAMIKVLPSLAEGIQFVGFIKELDLNVNISDPSQMTHYLMYNGVNQVVLGVTKSCYDQFGIPASIIYGNSNHTSDFTVDQVAPEIDQPGSIQEEIRAASGAIVTFDTTYIQQNFLLEDEQNSNRSDNEFEQTQNITQNLTQNNITQNKDVTQLGKDLNDSQITDNQGLQTAKVSKFKKVKIRINLEQEDIFPPNMHIKILKFQEVDENDTGKLNRQTYNFKSNHTNQNQILDKEEEYEEELNKDDNALTAQESVRDEQDQQNEVMRTLKDFKALISEKTVPKSIQILKKTVFILLIVLCILSGVELHYKGTQKSDIQEGKKAIDYAYTRHNKMVLCNYMVRKIQLLAEGLLTVPAGETSDSYGQDLQDELTKYVDELQDVQFNVIKSQLEIQDNSDEDYSSEQYQIEFLLQNGKTKTEDSVFTDAIFQYITEASSLTNSTISDFVSDENAQYVDDTQISIHFVRENGLFVLRVGSEDIANKFYEYYYDQTYTIKNYFLVIMILGIVFLVLSQILLIPIVFSVNRTNNKVLSLFGIIPEQEIKTLVTKCEAYMGDHLEDHHDKNEKNEQEQNQENNNNRTSNNIPQIQEENMFQDNDQLGLNESQQPMNNNLIHSEVTQDQNQTTNQQFITTQNNQLTTQGNNLQLPKSQGQKITTNFNTINNSHLNGSNLQGANVMNQIPGNLPNEVEKQKISQQQKKDDDDNNQEDKFVNSKDNNKKFYLICQFSFIALLFIIYFVVNFILEQQFLSNIRLMYNHLKYISMRPSLLEYNVMFTLEQVSVGSDISYTDSDDLVNYYNDLVYSNERNVYSTYQESYPGQIDSYLSEFYNFNYKSICEYSDSVSNTSDCQDVSQGILTKGLRTSIVALIEDTRDLVSDFNSDLDDQGKENLSTVTSDTVNSSDYTDIEDMLFYIVPSMVQLNNSFLQNIDQYLDKNSQVDTIKFVVFIILIFIIFFFVWTPYLSSLNNKIWRTKGMLNMIPIEIIMRHDKLRQMMQSGELLQAVR